LRNDHGAADAVAADVHLEERLLAARLDTEEVVLVPLVAADVRPGRPAELVRAGLGRDLHEAGRLAPVLGVVAARDDVDLADGVDVRGDVGRARTALFTDTEAVDRRVLVLRVAAADAQVGAPVPPPVVAATALAPDAR